MPNASWGTLFFLVGTTLLLGAGCARDPLRDLVPVAGKVTVDGISVPRGSLTFHPDSSKGNNSEYEAAGQIEADGTYKLYTSTRPGALPGWYKVVVLATEAGDPKDPYRGVRSLASEKYMSAAITDLSVEVVKAPSAGNYDLNLDGSEVKVVAKTMAHPTPTPVTAPATTPTPTPAPTPKPAPSPAGETMHGAYPPAPTKLGPAPPMDFAEYPGIVFLALACRFFAALLLLTMLIGAVQQLPFLMNASQLRSSPKGAQPQEGTASAERREFGRIFWFKAALFIAFLAAAELMLLAARRDHVFQHFGR